MVTAWVPAVGAPGGRTLRGYRSVMSDDATPQDTAETTEPAEPTEQTDDSSEGGQVSEVGNLAGGPETIYPDQATAGYPDTESDGPQEGTAGPNARPRDDRPGGGPDNPH